MPKNPWVKWLLGEHPAMVFSILYLIASLIGLLYSWAFLNAFGINVFRYADVSDFLLASLKEPMTWLLAFGALLSVAFDNACSLRLERRGLHRWFRWYGSERYRRVNYIVFFGLTGVLLFGYAVGEADKIRNGGGENFSVQLTDGTPPKDRLMLGTTARFVFLFDSEQERVEIHPTESVLTLSKLLPTKTERAKAE
ncbi:MAG: hypothetical protein AAFN07_14250 [Pseudomonadota bacterium]